MAPEKNAFYEVAKARTRMGLKQKNMRFNKHRPSYSQGDVLTMFSTSGRGYSDTSRPPALIIKLNSHLGV